jgi:isoleucyl-tRNA synthetase
MEGILDLQTQCKIGKIDIKKLSLEEKYILSRAESTIKKVTELFDNYELDSTIGEIEKLILDLSRVYIKLIRDKANNDGTRKIVADVIYDVYIKCLKIFSTTCPLICEDLWQKLKQAGLAKEESVHLSSWPKSDSKFVNAKLEKEFSIALEVIEKGLAERDKVQIGLKWPLSKAKITTDDLISKNLQEIIANQLNVKEVEIKKGKLNVKLDTKLTAELEAEGYGREISRKVQAGRKNAGLVKTDKIKLALIVDEDFAELIKNQIEMIKQRTNSDAVFIGTESDKDYKNKFEEKIKGKHLKILFTKI